MEQQISNKNALLQFFLSLVVLGAGFAIAVYYLRSAPEAKVRKRAPIPLTVQVEPARYKPRSLIISAMGTVIPAREITLSSRVSGEIVQMSPELTPGGFVEKGAHLLSVDTRDYKFTVLQRASEVTVAKSDLALEMGNQLIAQREFEILGEEPTAHEKQLMLRQPHLEHKRAILKAARAKLAQAELNLSRTRTDAPFNAVILSRTVNIGSYISAATPLAQLAGTNEFWLKLSIPVEQLQWIKIPSARSDAGARVKITAAKIHGEPVVRRGEILRLAPDLEGQGRMAVLYVSIKDPLCRLAKNSLRPRLLIGSYVKADIEGTKLKSAVAVKRNYVHNSNSLWIFSKDHTLVTREVDIIFKDRDFVYISSGISEGEQIITTPLSAPVSGMAVQLKQRKNREILPADSGEIEQ